MTDDARNMSKEQQAEIVLTAERERAEKAEAIIDLARAEPFSNHDFDVRVIDAAITKEKLCLAEHNLVVVQRDRDEKIARLVDALRRCQSQAGTPDAADGCRLIIQTVECALAAVAIRSGE